LDHEELVKSGRLFVREGSLIKQKKKGSQYCHFFLFTDMLLHTVQKKQKYKVKHKVPLSDVVLVDVLDTELLRNAFKISWGKDHNFIVSANTAEEKAAWLRDLKKGITDKK
jgi:hypothetical protein